MSANKNLLTQADKNLFAEIEDVLVRANANVAINLLNIAEIFAKLDQRFATMENKLEQLLAVRPSNAAFTPYLPSARLSALIDEHVKFALARAQHQHLEAVAAVARDALRDEFQQVRDFVEAKLKQVEALLAQRPLSEQPPRPN